MKCCIMSDAYCIFQYDTQNEREKHIRELEGSGRYHLWHMSGNGLPGHKYQALFNKVEVRENV